MEAYIFVFSKIRNGSSLIIELRKIIRMIGRAALLGFQLLKTYARVNLDI